MTDEDDFNANDLWDAFAFGLAPIIVAGIMIGWVECVREWGMQDPGFTVDQLRKLIAMRGIIRKILRGPNPDKEIVAWAMRGGKAEVISLAQVRTDRQRENRQDAAGSSP